MHCKPHLLLFAAVVTTLLSIAWIAQTLTKTITPLGDDHNATADGQQERYQHYEDLYAERDAKSVKKEAWLDFEINNTTDRERLDRTSDVVLRKEEGRLVEVGDPVSRSAEDVNKGTPLLGNETLLLDTEINGEAVTSSKHVGRDAIHQNTRENTSDGFKNGQAFSLPVPIATLPLGQILQTQWLKELRDFLSILKPHSGPISLVSSDYKYRELLLNWLISALVRVDTPLSNVLVLSLDPSLHTLLQGRGFACIHIPPESLLNPAVTVILSSHVASQVYVLRLTVMRFLNHWGFDVANYDTDAIIIKNPESLYYQKYGGSDFIGSYGHSPDEVQREWGIAICMGMVMIKSTIHTGI